MNRRRRLEVLEMRMTTAQRQASVSDAQAQAHDEAMQAAWEAMASTMSEDHARLFVETYRSALENGWPSIRDDPAAHFTHVCSTILNESIYDGRGPAYAGIKPEARFAMPPAVAEVYLTHNRFGDSSLPLHDCEDCGFQVPILTAPGKAGRRCFESCPLCGGKTGWYAYFSKHRGEK